ncbi:glycine-rich domain-containing protein [Streptomyces hirsutus]|uniref:glycine-rich domain-containing protein n=1 Tax=Streptomyces hirsutus TaxID=35620 RepID=UPI00363E9A87
MAGSGNRGHEFLRAVAGFTQSQGKSSSANKPFRLGRIDYEYNPADFLGGINPRVLFDGESTVGQKRYVAMAGYYPLPGARVLLAPVGTTYMILGTLEAKPHDPVVNHFTESDTWEMPPGARLLKVQVQGGGGAGGGVVASPGATVGPPATAAQAAAGGGGAGGAYGESWLAANAVISPVTVTVGTGGAAGTGTGGSGTTSSFGAYVSASGGPGGGVTGTGTGNSGISGATAASQVIVADLAIPGSGGGAGQRVPSGVSMGGTGGSSHLGGAGRGVAASGALVTGTDAAGYGGGGGGAVSGTTDNAASTGGNGSPGIVIVTTYF